MNKPRIVAFASGKKDGGGSGCENLVLASRKGLLYADIVAIVSNHADGGVRKRANLLDVPFLHFPGPWTGEEYQSVVNHLDSHLGVDFIALSGWLKLVKGLDPKTKFNSQTVFNIHPGPIPRFGGPGMYGHHVHEAVMAAYARGEVTHSAVTMHFVTEGKSDKDYDRGPVFFHKDVPIYDDDTPDTLGVRVNKCEHVCQPLITNLVVNRMITWDGVDPASLKIPNEYKIRNPY